MRRTREDVGVLEAATPTLRSLGPAFDENLHGRHVGIVLNALNDSSSNPPKNIALTGHYGSGKSSVILGVEARLKNAGINSVSLSLSSLGLDEERLAKSREGNGALPPLTRLIQKAIVKQLLYREAPTAMPGSRFFRIGSFNSRRGAFWSAVAGFGFFLAAVVFGLVGRVEEVAPRWLGDGPNWGPWAVVGAFSVLFSCAWFLGLRSVQNRVRLESLSAGGGGVKISLSEGESSYFDQYLDEIVYFFEQTNTTVAIFEDLDRFKDPHIFETLRELNTVLNNSGQLRSKPIRFVYAVRDSIFETLDGDVLGTDEALLEGRASELEIAAPANRTKFFDLVVPMIPFLTHRSARDLIISQFENCDQKPPAELINLVGAHLTDMRLIRNIRNEFEIYSGTVLQEGGLEGLNSGRLFAMVVYKNLYLDDFELIRHGKSNIDKAYAAFRSMIDYQMANQATLSEIAKSGINKSAFVEERYEALGARLTAVVKVAHGASRAGGQYSLSHEGRRYSPDLFSSAELWQSIADSQEGITVAANGRQIAALSFNEIVGLTGIDISSIQAHASRESARLQRESDSALKTRAFVSTATLGELLARTDLTMPRDDGELSLQQVVSEKLPPLAYELIASGYIDENYALYCSDYQGVSISVTAMNFILQFVQRNTASHRFFFGDRTSIDEVANETGARFLDGESIFNIEVFDHYLAKNSDHLAEAFKKLGNRPDSPFVDVYLVDGAERTAFVGNLAARWPNIFVRLVGNGESATTDETIALVDAGLQHVSESVAYETSEEVVAFLSTNYLKMETLVKGGQYQ